MSSNRASQKAPECLEDLDPIAIPAREINRVISDMKSKKVTFSNMYDIADFLGHEFSHGRRFSSYYQYPTIEYIFLDMCEWAQDNISAVEDGNALYSEEKKYKTISTLLKFC